jgi:hypothetical protein
MEKDTKPVDINKINTELYLKTLNEKEVKSYTIAKSHLGSSFSLEKSVGYLKWKKKQEENMQNCNG